MKRIVIACLVVGACTSRRPSAPAASDASPSTKSVKSATAAGAKVPRLPLYFEENRGQFDARVHYVAQEPGASIGLTDRGAVLALRRTDGKTQKITMTVSGANPRARLEAGQRLVTESNYYLGNDPQKWREHVPSFGEVAYRGVRPGVDLVFHESQQGRIEYDFVIAPGASADVTMDIDGADNLRVAADGALEIPLPGGIVRQAPPLVYQVIDGKRRELTASYRLVAKNRVGFVVARWDRARPLVIDPVIVYAAYTAGSTGGGGPTAIAVDPTGAAYVSGSRLATDFPITTTGLALEFQNHVVFKVNAAGNAVVYATHVGGTNKENPAGSMGVDSSGAAYVGGLTFSSDFPTTTGAYQRTSTAIASGVGYVTKLAADGTLSYSTLLAGTASSIVYGVAADSAGAAYVVGNSTAGFPTTAGAFIQTSLGGSPQVFVSKLNAAGSALVYSTWLQPATNDSSSPGTTGPITVDATGAAYVAFATGSANMPVKNAYQATFSGSEDIYVVKLNAAGSDLSYGTYLGGNSQGDIAGCAVDSTGALVIVGETLASDFPNTLGRPTSAGFITKLAPSGSTLAWSSYLGSFMRGVAVDGVDAVYVLGVSNDSHADIPLVRALAGATGSGFLTKLATDGTVVYSTLLNGLGGALAARTAGDAYITGNT